MLYGLEYLAIKKTYPKANVAEMRMLKWMNSRSWGKNFLFCTLFFSNHHKVLISTTLICQEKCGKLKCDVEMEK